MAPPANRELATNQLRSKCGQDAHEPHAGCVRSEYEKIKTQINHSSCLRESSSGRGSGCDCRYQSTTECARADAHTDTAGVAICFTRGYAREER